MEIMAWAPKTLNHPTFGPCELVPSLVAIKWVNPLNPKAVASALSAHSLVLASTVPRLEKGPSGSLRDPRLVTVNQSETLTWASGKLTDKLLGDIRSDSKVEWVAPVYRATSAVAGPYSYFAVNPTVLLLSQEAAANLLRLIRAEAICSKDS
jgi:hypothetical protein